MAGLLSGILPYVYSQSDRLKRNVNGLLSDPRGSMEQTAGGLLDAHRGQQNLLAQAFSDPGQPFKMTDPNAMEAAAYNMLSGPLGIAPMGMVKAGQPFTFLRNTQKSPYLGETYGQHIEPAGRYLLEDTAGAASKLGAPWESGTATFKKPL
jgi:hypothetical protein